MYGTQNRSIWDILKFVFENFFYGFCCHSMFATNTHNFSFFLNPRIKLSKKGWLLMSYQTVVNLRLRGEDWLLIFAKFWTNRALYAWNACTLFFSGFLIIFAKPTRSKDIARSLVHTETFLHFLISFSGMSGHGAVRTYGQKRTRLQFRE